MAALGDHDGIDDEAANAMAAQSGGDRGGDLGGAEHAQFHRVDADVGKERVELLCDEIDRDGVDPGHALGVLRGERGDDARAVGAEGGERFQVGEETGSTRGIDAGDTEDIGNHARESGVNHKAQETHEKNPAVKRPRRKACSIE